MYVSKITSHLGLRDYINTPDNIVQDYSQLPPPSYRIYSYDIRHPPEYTNIISYCMMAGLFSGHPQHNIVWDNYFTHNFVREMCRVINSSLSPEII